LIAILILTLISKEQRSILPQIAKQYLY
jgi:hypothetical protein